MVDSTEPSAADATAEVQPQSKLKLLLDFGPLLAFFVVNRTHDIYAATGTLMALSAVALPLSWKLEGKLPKLPLVSTVIVVIMGGITLYLQDEDFIKLKPTILYGVSALVLLVGQLCGKALLQPLLGWALELTETGWRAITWRWILFFGAMALLNEILRRALTTDQWVTFKVFGAMALTFAFAMAQYPLLQRYGVRTESDA